jgi:hypothetical protein
MTTTTVIDFDNVVMQTIIDLLLQDAALFGVGKIAQPNISEGYVGVYPRSIPAPDADIGVERDELYPAFVIFPQGIIPNYVMDGEPNTVGFTGMIQITMVDQGRATGHFINVLNEMYRWLSQLNQPNATIIESLLVATSVSFQQIDAAGNPFVYSGARYRVAGRVIA